MKPHEETWTFEESPLMRVSFPTRRNAQASGVIMGGVPSDEDKERLLRIIAAAPEMARALLGVKDVLQQHPGLHRDVVDALTKAGVL